MSRPIVINLFGEPSAGKSTAALDITARLKRKGINAEYVSEYAKDKTYEQDDEVFKYQEYIFGKQSFRMARVREKVQVIVTDSPLLLSIVYNENEYLTEDFDKVVLGVFNIYENKNFLLNRRHRYYADATRRQDEDGALVIRNKILKMFDDFDIPYTECTSSWEDCEKIVDDIVREINEYE